MASTEGSVNQPMGITEFQRTSEFLLLTELQKQWLLKLIETNDARQATLATYKRAAKLGSAYVSQLTSKCCKGARGLVRAAIAKFHGWSARERYIDDLEHSISKAKGGERPQLLVFKARILGLVSDVPRSLQNPSSQ